MTSQQRNSRYAPSVARHRRAATPVRITVRCSCCRSCPGCR